MKEIMILCLLHAKNAGDNSNVLGTAHSLQQKLGLSNEQVIEINIDQPIIEHQQDYLIRQVNDISDREGDKTFIAVGAGEKGFYSLIALKKSESNKNIYASWCGHQFFNFLQDQSTALLDSIALPHYVMTPQIRKILNAHQVKFKEINSVPHNINSEDLAQDYSLLQSQIQMSPKYLMVILSGDAPAPGGEMKYFTQEQAQKFADYVARVAQANGQFIMVTNGPRTGKYDPVTKRVVNEHKEEEGIDEVSKAFCDRLAEVLPKGKKGFQFFDFKFLNNGKVQSSYKGLLHLIKITNDSVVYIPGESTSMISEAINNLPRDKVVIFETESMNENHKKHVQEVYKEGIGLVHYNDNHYMTEQRKRGSYNKPIVRDADKVAEFIISNYFEINKLKIGVLASTILAAYFAPLPTAFAAAGIIAANVNTPAKQIVGCILAFAGTSVLHSPKLGLTFIASNAIFNIAKNSIMVVKPLADSISNDIFTYTNNLQNYNPFARGDYNIGHAL